MSNNTLVESAQTESHLVESHFVVSVTVVSVELLQDTIATTNNVNKTFFITLIKYCVKMIKPFFYIVKMTII